MLRTMIPHIHQEGMKRFVIDILRLHGESREGSQPNPNKYSLGKKKGRLSLALDLIVVRWWDWGKSSHLCGSELHVLGDYCNKLTTSMWYKHNKIFLLHFWMLEMR